MKKLILIFFILTATVSAQDWIENNGKREWAQSDRNKVLVSNSLEFINWAGSNDSTYLKIDVSSLTDSIWYDGDTTVIGINEFYHAKFYNTGTENLSWDAVLYQKPANQFSWTFPFVSNNLTFYYQPPLTLEEIDAGDERPDSVVGSYAVYHSYKANRFIDGPDTTDWGIGKAFHIYRPYVYDSAGDTVWMDLEIDTVSHTVTIAGSRSWFRNAVYPVVIDPEFGYTTAGGSNLVASTTECWALIGASYVHTATTGDIITQFHVHGRTYANPSSLDFSAYTYTGGVPVTRLSAGVTITQISSTFQWWASSVVSQALANGKVYCLAEGNVSSAPRISYDAGSANYSRHTASSTLPATWTQFTTGANILSIKVTYTAGGGGGGAFRGQVMPTIIID